jgi:hypothetical protein
MGVTLNFCLAEQCDCKTALFNDTTGDYNAIFNAGGWGTPNTESSSITSATISILPKDYVYPIVLSFTIASNVITAATRQDQFGDVVNILSLLNSTIFPFYQFEINSEILFGSSPNSDLPDGAYLVTYECDNGTDFGYNQQWVYFVGLSTRCKNDAVVKGAAGNMTIENQINIFLNYDYLLGGISLGDKNFVNSQVEAMEALCLRCGCGCGC